MKNKFAAIPTTYKGINFRSRLEARWAMFFDLLGWIWEYESVDLNGWIPDFTLKGNEDIYIEVKYFPVYTSFPEVDERWLEQMKKIEKADPDLPVLLLSNTPLDNEANSAEKCFGLVFEQFMDKWLDSEGQPDVMTELYIAQGIPPFLTTDLPFIHRPNYGVKGKSLTSFPNMDKDEIKDKWNKAGNETQWKGKRSS